MEKREEKKFHKLKKVLCWLKQMQKSYTHKFSLILLRMNFKDDIFVNTLYMSNLYFEMTILLSVYM